MKLSREEVKRVAELARINFSEEEIETFTEQMGNILEYIEKLNELDTSDVRPTSHVLDLVAPMREDAVEHVLGVEEALDNAPYKADDDHFVVPKVI